MSSPFDYLASGSRTSRPSLLADQRSVASTMAAQSCRFLLTGPSLSALVDTKSSPSVPEIHVHEDSNSLSFPKLPSSGTDEDNINASRNQGGESIHGACYHNNILYSCTHVVPGAGPRVIHVNCYGVPLGKIHCGNMSLNPKYPTINCKCRSCIRDEARIVETKVDKKLDDVMMAEAKKLGGLKLKMNKGIDNQTRGRNEEKTREVSSKKKSILEHSTRNPLLGEARKLKALQVEMGKSIDNQIRGRNEGPFLKNNPALAGDFSKLTLKPAASKAFNPDINKAAAKLTHALKLELEEETAEEMKKSEAAAGLLLLAQSKFHNATATEDAARIQRKTNIMTNGVDDMTTAEVNELLSKAPVPFSDLLNPPTRSQNKPLPMKRTTADNRTKSTAKAPLNADQMAKQFAGTFAANEAAALTLRLKLPTKPMAESSSKIDKMPRPNDPSKSMAESWYKVDKKPSKTPTKAGTVLKEVTEDGWYMLDEFDELDWVDVDVPSSQGPK